MAEVKDKVVTVESLAALHDYDEATFLKTSGALTTLGITATASELNKLDGVTATATELNYVDGVTSAIQTQLNAKQATITGAATTIASSNLTASRALVSNSSGKVAVSAVTSTELGYLDGVTSNVQTQLNTKSDNDHTHSPIGIDVTGENLDDYVDAGLYSFAASYTPTNAPSGNTNGWLLVMPWTSGYTSTVKQIWYRHGAVNDNDFNTYVRTKIGDYGWSDWAEYYTTKGGTITGNVEVDGTTTFNDLAIFANNNRGIAGIDSSGNQYHQFQPVNDSGNCAIGHGMYEAETGSTDIYGNIVTINSKNAIGLNADRINLNNDMYVPNDVSIYSGSKLVFTPLSSSGNTAIGYSHYDNSSGNTNIYGNGVYIWSREAGLNASPYGENQLLWSGESYVESGVTLNLSKNVTAMPHGIVLIFSAYTVGEGAETSHWHYFFVPKYAVGIDNSGGSSFTLAKGSTLYYKYIYINDSTITGHADNNNSSYSFHGQTVDNRAFVLRYVIGV